MKLAGITISNLFNFPYLADLQKAQEVTFYNTGENNVNVLIGPNGAGKSKFLEVVKYMLRFGLRKDYAFHRDMFASKHAKDMKSVITEESVVLDQFYKHVNAPDKPSEVIIRLTLTDHDYANLRFLCTHYQEINTLIQTYSQLDVRFDEMNIDDIVLDESTMAFHCVFDAEKKTITPSYDNLSRVQQYVLEYLLHNELIQICMDIHALLTDQKDRPDHLYSTFAFLGYGRTIEGMLPKVTPHDRSGFLYEKGQYSVHAGYYMCAKKIRQILSPTQKTLSEKDIQNKLKKSEFFVSLSALLQKYFNKTLCVTLQDDSLEFCFVDTAGRRLGFGGFSDGEQSLLLIILTIYGYDLQGGFLIIDEPEIHFHPQMQRSLSRMMEKISAKIGTQFILSTYSPLFINESNINHVYRFSKIRSVTHIQNPAMHLSSSESTLVHLLKFENLSKIFFVNKIIMVEGETDAYFFDFYLSYLHTLPEWKTKLTDYEIININGKGSYTVWKKFLSKFGITSYFIGDRDNIVDYGFLTQMELGYYYKQAKSHFSKKKNKMMHYGGSHYNKLVATIRDLFTPKYQQILAHIKELYLQHVFILQKGDIEAYITLPEKGLESTVAFCHHDFKKWLADKQYEPQRQELHDIISHIFS